MNLEKTLFISDKPCSRTQTGGHPNPAGVIQQVATLKNPYLYFENCERTFTFDKSVNIKKDIANSEYLGRGTFTAVFGILDENNNKFVLRIEELKKTNELNEFIQQWEKDKEMFPKNVIDIWAYGVAIVQGVIVGTYTITTKYNDYKKIEELNLFQKNIFVRNMLSCLNELQQNNIYYRDFKIQNIGFDNDIDLNFIILDYDNVTLMDRENNNFNKMCGFVYKISAEEASKKLQSIDSSIDVCSGTYSLLIEQYEYYPEFKDVGFKKYYCLGLASILTSIYFVVDDQQKETVNFIRNQIISYYSFENNYKKIINEFNAESINNSNLPLSQLSSIYTNGTNNSSHSKTKNNISDGLVNSLFGDLEGRNTQNISELINSKNDDSILNGSILNSISNYFTHGINDNNSNMSFNSVKNSNNIPMQPNVKIYNNPFSSNSTKINSNGKRLLTGGYNMEGLQMEFLDKVNLLASSMTPNYKSYECAIENMYVKHNFYNNLRNFLINIIVNMMHPDANKIFTENEILNSFIQVFLFATPIFR